MRHRLIVAVICMLMLDCKSSRTIEHFERFTLERTECFGVCPKYIVTVSGNGTVEYRGERHVKEKGVRSRMLSAEQVGRLISLLNEVDYWALSASYATSEDGCPTVVTDNPAVITTLVTELKSKTVTHYLGCRERGNKDDPLGAVHPRALNRFENDVDSLLGTSEWIGVPGLDDVYSRDSDQSGRRPAALGTTPPNKPLQQTDPGVTPLASTLGPTTTLKVTRKGRATRPAAERRR